MKTYKRIIFPILAALLFFSCAIISLYQFTVKKSVSYETPKVSVVIPVYNVEKYLPACLDSVINQTMKEIEIICINDGSTDDSLSILEYYKNIDGRVKIVSQENKGISAVRNVGISKSVGEYTIFVDSDDFLSPKVLEISYEDAKKNDADVVEFSVLRFNDGEDFLSGIDKIENGDLKIIKKEPNESPYMKNVNPYDKHFLNYCTIWNKLWRTSFIKDNNLSFNEKINFNEDLLFNFYAFPLLRNAVIHQNRDMLYFYRKKRSGSITSEIKIIDELENRMKICEELAGNGDKINFDGSDEWLVGMLITMAANKINILENLEHKKNYSRRLLDIIENYCTEHEVKPNASTNQTINVLRKNCE